MPEPRRRRSSKGRPWVIRWSIVVPLMALTWALMAYAIYHLLSSARL